MTPTQRETIRTAAVWLDLAAALTDDARLRARYDESRDALRNALRGPRAEIGWRPIEGAPQDGTDVDLWAAGSRWSDCHYHCGEWLKWRNNPGEEPRWHRIKGATHWRAIPPGPDVEAGDE